MILCAALPAAPELSKSERCQEDLQPLLGRYIDQIDVEVQDPATCRLGWKT